MPKLPQFFHHLLRSDTLWDSSIVLGGSVLSSLLGFVFVSIVARSMGPTEFGIFSTIINYVVFLSAVVDMGISNSLVRFVQATPTLGRQRIWISTGLAIVVVTTVSWGLMASGMYEMVLRHLWQHPSGYAGYVGLAIFVIALNIFFLSIFQSIRAFWLRSLVDNVFSITRLLVIAMVLGWGTLSLGWSMGSIIIGYAIAVGVGWYLARKYLQWQSVKRDLMGELLMFSRWMGGVNLFANLYGKLDVMMLAWLSSAYTTGIYAAASRFILIFPLVVTSLSSVVAPRFSSFTDPRDLRLYVRHSLWICLLVAGGMLLLIPLATPLILIPYSEAFLETVPIFQWLVVANIPLVLSIPVTNAIVYFFKKPQYITAIAAGQFVGLAGLNMLFIPWYGGFGPVYSLCILNLVGMGLQYGLYLYLKR